MRRGARRGRQGLAAAQRRTARANAAASAWLGWATRNARGAARALRGYRRPRAARRAGRSGDALVRGRRPGRAGARAAGRRRRPVRRRVRSARCCVTELLQRIASRRRDRARAPTCSAAPGWFGGPLPEWFAYEVVERLHPTLSVGANEIQRTTIAERGPRASRPSPGRRGGDDGIPSGGVVDRRGRTVGDPGDRPAARPRAGRRVGAQRGEGRRRRGHAGGHRPDRRAGDHRRRRAARARDPTASATRRQGEALDAAAVPEMVRMLEAGVNVVTVSTPGLVHPAGLPAGVACAARGGGDHGERDAVRVGHRARLRRRPAAPHADDHERHRALGPHPGDLPVRRATRSRS